MKFNMEAQKEHFKDHVAHFKDYGDIKVIDFYNPNSSAYRIRFLFDESIYTLHITGDLGNLTASNYKNMNYADFYKHFCGNSGYFEGKVKCHSRDIYEWDEDKARKELEEMFERDYDEYFDEDFECDSDDEEEYNEKRKERIEEKIDDILEDFESRKGLSEKGVDLLSSEFSDSWEFADSIGKEETGILDLYLLAFELAYKQLNPDKMKERKDNEDF